MKTQELVKFIRCPITKQNLYPADKDMLTMLENKRKRGALFRKSGEKVEVCLNGGLVTRDQSTFYPVVEDIPQLLAPEGISLRENFEDRIDATLPPYWEPYSEMGSYDDISSHHMESNDIESALGESIRSRKTMHESFLETFPEPAEFWLDAKGCLLAQQSAYQHLGPISDSVVLQIGGPRKPLAQVFNGGGQESLVAISHAGRIKAGQAIESAVRL